MKRLTIALTVATAWLLIAAIPAVSVDNASVVELDPSLVISGPETSPPMATDGDRAAYSGTIRLHIVEPSARWRDSNNQLYDFGLLDYALTDALSVADGATWETELTWNSAANGLGTIYENNIMVQAVVFNANGVPAYSDPPTGGAYTAYYADAAAQAIPGTPGMNSTALGSTHTVFVEEATATWCPNCPTTRAVLHAIYATGTYNFIYNAQVVDKNSTAVQRANEFNLIYVPTCYFDAGFRILIGGTSTWSYYQSRLNDASNRTVTPLNMITAIQWLGGNDVKVRVRVGNGVPVNVAPAAPNAPTGITKGLMNVNYDFTALSTDGDGDDLFFQWDFGDGTITDWLGPFTEGSSVIQPYAWTDKGTFDIKVRTKDVYEETTAWSPVLAVTIGCCVVPGDFNHTGNVDITDLTDMVDFMFAGGTPAECAEEGNTNGLDSIDITDLTFLVDFMFAGGAAPPACP